MPSVSVIIPYYKKINYIKKTINSVLNQTFQDFEIILIYDDEKLDDCELSFTDTAIMPPVEHEVVYFLFLETLL